MSGSILPVLRIMGKSSKRVVRGIKKRARSAATKLVRGAINRAKNPSVVKKAKQFVKAKVTHKIPIAATRKAINRAIG